MVFPSVRNKIPSNYAGDFCFCPIGAILTSMVIAMPNRQPKDESPANVPASTSGIPVFESSIGRTWLIGYIVTRVEFVPLKKAA